MKKWVLFLLLMLIPTLANAAGVDPFHQMLITFTGWVTGSLGKFLAVFALVIAGFHGTHGCLKCSAGALLMAIILAFGPDVISSTFVAAP